MFRKFAGWRASCSWLFSAVALFALAAHTGAAEVTVKTGDGDGADAEVRENANNSGHDAGRGDNDQLNVRYFTDAGNERNEVVLLRFDLNKIKPDDVTGSRLELTAQRSQPAGSGLQVYGLKPSVKNQKWDEFDTRFSTAPGLKWDDNFATRGLVEEDTVPLGKMVFPVTNEGTVVPFESDALTAFLKDGERSVRAENPNLVTLILMMDKPSNNQRRICSKEYTDENDANAPRLVIQTAGQ